MRAGLVATIAAAAIAAGPRHPRTDGLTVLDGLLSNHAPDAPYRPGATQ